MVKRPLKSACPIGQTVMTGMEMKLNTLLSQKWFAHTLAVCIAFLAVLVVIASQPSDRVEVSDNQTIIDPSQLSDEAWTAIMNNNIEHILTLLPPYAEAGNEIAASLLGKIYIHNRSGFRDLEKGQYWLQKTIPSKFGISETIMAESCDQPIVETIDYECALKWYKAAYEKRAKPRTVFQYVLLLIDKEAKQFEPDHYQKAFQALNSIKNSTDYKNDDYFNLIFGQVFLWGIGTEQNLSLGARYLTIADERGTPEASRFLYHLHFHGLIDGASPEQAAYYKKKALTFMSKDALENFLDEDEIALLKQEKGNGEWR